MENTGWAEKIIKVKNFILSILSLSVSLTVLSIESIEVKHWLEKIKFLTLIWD